MRGNDRKHFRKQCPDLFLCITFTALRPRSRGVLQYATSKKCGFSSPSRTLGSIIRGLKSSATKIINQIRNSPGVPVWQRNYYEHIIRNETELNKIREYIINNPLNWKTDENYMAD
jgi:hypothetical protein